MKNTILYLFSYILLSFALSAQQPGVEVEGSYGNHIRLLRDIGHIDITPTQSPNGLDILNSGGHKLMSLISDNFDGTDFGKIGLGTALPQSIFSIKAADDYFDGPNILLTGNGSDQVESGRIRFVEGTATNNYRGGYIHYDGFANRLHIGVHTVNGSSLSDEIDAISIVRNNGHVGLGTPNPKAIFHVKDPDVSTGQRKILGLFESPFNKRPTIFFGTNNTVIGYGIEYDGNLGGNLNKLKIFYKDAQSEREVMTINSGTNSARIGINTLTPAVTLDIESDVGTHPTIRLTSQSNLREPQIELNSNTTNNDWRIINDIETGFLQLEKGDITATTTKLFSFQEDRFAPVTSGDKDLGNFGNRWEDLYLENGPNVSSDRRLKEDIQELDYGLNELLNLRPVRYQWKADHGEEKLGLIAQDVLEVVPEVVSVPEDPEAFLGMDYTELIPVLIHAIQELKQEVDELKKKL